MNNKVYYGQYSLTHWIELILRGKIALPPYQRHFVWNESKSKKLIESLRQKQFVPPITIGAFRKSTSTENFIIDGQQRLTSIVLAYLGRFPDIKHFSRTSEDPVYDSDASDEEDQDERTNENHKDTHLNSVIEWNISEIIKLGRTKEDILEIIEKQSYKRIDFDIDSDFLDDTYLGFCYLVPESNDETNQQAYYSSVFRNMNVFGQTLLPQESRAALYYLDPRLAQLFQPDFAKNIIIKTLNTKTKLDFVRYLALLSQFHKYGDANKVALGRKAKMELLYEEYIYSAINTSSDSEFATFTAIFPKKEYNRELQELSRVLDAIKFHGEYNSIIDVDIFMFGLTYHIVFKKSQVEQDKLKDLAASLKKLSATYKNDDGHQKSPNKLQFLRKRIYESINECQSAFK